MQKNAVWIEKYGDLHRFEILASTDAPFFCEIQQRFQSVNRELIS